MMSFKTSKGIVVKGNNKKKGKEKKTQQVLSVEG